MIKKISLVAASVGASLMSLMSVAHATTLVTLDSATTTFSNVAPWATEVFTDFVIILAVVCGVTIGALFLNKVISTVIKGAKMVLGSGRGRRGRRGRR